MNEPHIFTRTSPAEFLPTSEIPGTTQPTVEEAAAKRPSGDKYVTFFLGGSLFAVPASKVLEVTRPTTITPLPHAPQRLLGIAGVRGEVVAVIDLRSAIGATSAPTSDRPKLVILNAEENETRIGFLVDAMHEIAFVAADEIGNAEHEYIIGTTASDGASLRILAVDRLSNLLSNE